MHSIESWGLPPIPMSHQIDFMIINSTHVTYNDITMCLLLGSSCKIHYPM